MLNCFSNIGFSAAAVAGPFDGVFVVDPGAGPPDLAGCSAVDIEARVKLKGRTGVEMEALTAVSVAALTVYDMCKAVDRGMRIEAIRLVHKDGGHSGEYLAE